MFNILNTDCICDCPSHNTARDSISQNTDSICQCPTLDNAHDSVSQNVSAQHWTPPRTDSQNIDCVCECPTLNSPNDSVSQNTDCPQCLNSELGILIRACRGHRFNLREGGLESRSFSVNFYKGVAFLIETANNSTYQSPKTITNSRQQLGLTAASWSRPATN